ncbi:mediator of RNA polymerase II transcription subunit 20 [Eupeodes corollae]|uniref:mediator of RNA polymerase II transcription subunit 20 n=1 Tax=Eupeodes corollae TaxID=290404 RepID=UPI00249321D9|nr:mediator of RNA polymerase II transcription subunit 20 [Eupeodes corollae]
MGVTVLLPYQVPEGKSGSQSIEYLTKRLLALGAIQTGHFLVDCETYISTPPNGPSKTVHVLHNSEYPASTFSILDNGSRHIPLVADNLFDLLMLKMTSVYSSKKQTKIESKGTRFEYGDFVIKLGSVAMMEHFKGILIEMEYQPCVMLSNCWEMMREVLQGFLGIGVPPVYPIYFLMPSISNMGHTNKQNEIYEPIDTINQYLEHFTHYRKPSSTSHLQVPPGMRV